ncbi:MAG: hypothetical protein JSS30_00265 [Verrucomicrobia bacterium]|nr:hypothetical protein [Verrucomicrobiota bacterium]
MIIAFRSRIILNQVFAFAKWAISAMTVAISIYFAVALFASKPLESIEATTHPIATFDVEKMLTGPLALYENKRSPMVIALEQNLVLLAQNVRPDLGKGEKVYRIGLKGSDEQRLIKENEPICFSWNEEKFEFADGGRQMIPQLINGDEILLKIGDEELSLQEKPKNIDNFDQIQAKWWGNDLFFREYGGEEYRQLGEKYKIELTSGTGRYFVYLQPGDFLTLKEGRWTVSEPDPSVPIAVFRETSDNEVELEGWDVNGEPLFYVRLSLQKNQPIRFVPDQVIADPKMRSIGQVSCKIGKKRLVLRPSDWVIKTQAGWRKLITINEIESYLNNEIVEELFVVDSIDQSGHIRGRHFDDLRTQMKPFTIQAAALKGKPTKKRISKPQ